MKGLYLVYASTKFFPNPFKFIVLNELSTMPAKTLGSGGVAPPFITSTLDELDQLHAPVTLPPRKPLAVSEDCLGTQSRTGRY
jgi:hypothetical protein